MGQIIEDDVLSRRHRVEASAPAGRCAHMKLGLGTVQFGMPYGATNTAGIPDLSAVREILAIARNANVDLVDTAASYGAAEQVLGDLLPGEWSPRLVTKIPPLGDGPITRAALTGVRDGALRSIERLGRRPLYAVLVHHAGDILKRGGDRLIDMLRRLKEEGSTEKIGVSVYGGEELDAALARFDPDIVQLPYSLCDQRLHHSGHLKTLHDSGIEVHARSIFLQGILLTTPDKLPPYFSPLRTIIRLLDKRYGTCPARRVAVCLKAVRMAPEIDTAIVGVTEPGQLRTILDAMRLESEINLEPAQFRVDHGAMLDPSTWPPRDSLLAQAALTT